MDFEIMYSHVDYWEPATEGEVFGLLMQEKGCVTPSLFALACGEEVCFPAYTIRQRRVENES